MQWLRTTPTAERRIGVATGARHVCWTAEFEATVLWGEREPWIRIV